MAISSKSAPAALSDDVASELRSLRSASGADDPALDLGAGANVLNAAELPIYGMPYATLRDQQRLSDPNAALKGARRRGWRFLVNDGSDTKLVDVIKRGRRDKPITTILDGPVVERFVTTGTLAENDAPEGEFDARILEFGRLGLSLLWLYSPDQEDIFYSLGGQDPKALSATEVFREARILSRQRSWTANRRSKSNGDAVQEDDRGG